jgi:hypothetical protein
MHQQRRAWIVAALAVAVLVPVGVAWGLGGTRSVPGTRLSCLDWTARTAPVSTTSRTWTDVPGMKLRGVLAQNFAVQLSATFNGSDVQLRVMDATAGGRQPLLPSSTTLRVPAVPTGFSFTWVGTNPAQRAHTFRLQWRLPSGGSSEMIGGNLSLVYQGAPAPGSC